MILDALVRLYEQLARDGKVPAIGQSKASVMYAIDIDEDGTFLQLTPLYETKTVVGKNKKEKTIYIPREIWVPEQEVRTSGILPYLLCDKAKYLLGLEYSKKAESVEFARNYFEAAGKLHEEVLGGIQSEFSEAIINYFKKNTFEEIQQIVSGMQDQKKIKPDQCLYVFRMNDQLATEDQEIMNACCQAGKSSDGERGICLVTGKEDFLTDKHFGIKGIGDKPNEFFTSFNNSAFCSYGHAGNENAPIGKYAASAYAIALSYLLTDNKYRMNIGDTAVVCWADKDSEIYQGISVLALNSAPQSNPISEDELCTIVKNLAAGESVEYHQTTLNADTGFYIMGIEANASRLSLKFYYEDTFGHLMQNVQSHWDAMEIDRPQSERRNPYVWAILNETAIKSDQDKLLGRIRSDLFYSILFAQPYPDLLQNCLQERILANRSINFVCASALKAFYLRSPYTIGNKETLTPELNVTSEYVPYVLGRLFALYEKIEENARGTISIRDSYFRSACQTPLSVFALLAEKAVINQMLNRRNNEPAYYCNEKELQSIMNLLLNSGDEIPAVMNTTQQGYFMIGYYQEVQNRYKKKEERINAPVVDVVVDPCENCFMDAGRLLSVMENLRFAVQKISNYSTKEELTVLLETPSVAIPLFKTTADAYIAELKRRDYGRAMYFEKTIQKYTEHKYRHFFTNKEKAQIILGYYAEKGKMK